jgi:hypothetical protein
MEASAAKVTKVYLLQFIRSPAPSRMMCDGECARYSCQKLISDLSISEFLRMCLRPMGNLKISILK